MKDGFIKVAAGTVDVVVADVQYNTEQILARMREADAAGVNLLTLPELCLTGYTCGDLFFSDCLLPHQETQNPRFWNHRIHTIQSRKVRIRSRDHRWARRWPDRSDWRRRGHSAFPR